MRAIGRRPWAFLVGVILLAPVMAAAAPVVMVPHMWQVGMQAAHSPVERDIQALNWWVTIVVAVISVFVAGLLLYVVWRYDHRRHPVASTISHNSILEAAWTVIPVLILVAIAIPSFRLVYYEDRVRDADMTIKVTGHQWYWEYTYPDAGGMHFDSYIVPEDELKKGQLRRLTADNKLVLPVNKNIRILTTSADVIHSFFVPSLGVQRYAIPGRTIETWVRIDAPGDYYGECNQICGMNHSAMPINVRAVSEGDFKTWLAHARTQFSQANPGGTLALASEH